MMKVYEHIWEDIVIRTVILGFSLALIFFLIDMVFFLWPQEDLESTLPILYDDIAGIQLVDILHVILWSFCYFFFFIVYSNLKDIFEFAVTVIDFIGLAVMGGLILFIIYNEWIALGFLVVVFLEYIYFYAAIGKE